MDGLYIPTSTPIEVKELARLQPIFKGATQKDTDLILQKQMLMEIISIAPILGS